MLNYSVSLQRSMMGKWKLAGYLVIMIVLTVAVDVVETVKMSVYDQVLVSGFVLMWIAERSVELPDMHNIALLLVTHNNIWVWYGCHLQFFGVVGWVTAVASGMKNLLQLYLEVLFWNSWTKRIKDVIHFYNAVWYGCYLSFSQIDWTYITMYRVSCWNNLSFLHF